MTASGDIARRSARVPEQVSCAGKKRFETRALAGAVASRTRRASDKNRSAYRCAHCDGYHLGTNSGLTRHARLALRSVKEIQRG